MAKPDIRIFPTLEEASWAAATRFEDLARLADLAKRVFSAALSGGSTPRLLYRILGSPVLASRIHWENIHLFQADERCVMPDHPESNYRMIRQELLDNAQIPEENFHRIPAELQDREKACWEFADELARVLKPKHDEWPRLDLIFLGMGSDGHTASLFPGTTALSEHVLWVCPNYIEKYNKHRITMTFPVLKAAAEVIFLVSGGEKAEVLRKVLEGPPGQLPAQRVQPLNGRLSWFVDEPAARLLSTATRGDA